MKKEVQVRDILPIDEQQYNTFSFGQAQVKVLKYLPIEKKIDVIQVALQKAEQDGIYNNVKVQVFFNLNIVYSYTNLFIEPQDRQTVTDEYALYDRLYKSGLMAQVLSTMDQDEYDSLLSFLVREQEDSLNYRNTAAAVIRSLIADLPVQAEAMREILQEMDTTKFQYVTQLAKDAGVDNETAAASN